MKNFSVVKGLKMMKIAYHHCLCPHVTVVFKKKKKGTSKNIQNLQMNDFILICKGM